MNNFLCTIDEKLASEIDAVLNPLLAGDYGSSDENVRFQVMTIAMKEARDAIAKTKTSKSSGKGISCCFLKLALPFIENSLACLFNTSVET